MPAAGEHCWLGVTWSLLGVRACVPGVLVAGVLAAWDTSAGYFDFPLASHLLGLLLLSFPFLTVPSPRRNSFAAKH